MTRASRTKLLLLLCCVLLLLLCCVLLTACLESKPPTQPAPSPSAVGGASETAKALCSVWLRTLPTWADEDTETTKDQIDYAIRSQETTCGSLIGRNLTGE
jgi:hypothetical protein